MKKKKSKRELGDNEKIAVKSAAATAAAALVTYAAAPVGIFAAFASAPIWAPIAAGGAAVVTAYSIGKYLDKDKK